MKFRIVSETNGSPHEKRRAYNEFFVGRILSILAVEPTDENCWKLIDELLILGVKAA